VDPQNYVMPVRGLGEPGEDALCRVEPGGRLERAGQAPGVCDAVEPEGPVLADPGVRPGDVPPAGMGDELVGVGGAVAAPAAVYLTEIGRWRRTASPRASPVHRAAERDEAAIAAWLSVSGKGSGRVSVAGLACLKAGAPGRLFCRMRIHRGAKGERRSMSEADYADLIAAAHRTLAAPVILIWAWRQVQGCGACLSRYEEQ
jgi:hypothetical protein